MANNLQVNEGTSGKYVRTIDTGSGVHVPLDGLILDDGNGSWSPIQRRANAIRTSLENDEVGIAKENTLSSIGTAIGSQGDAAETDVTASASLIAFVKGIVDQLGKELTITLDGETVSIDSLPSGLAQESTLSTLASVVNGSNQLQVDIENQGSTFDVSISSENADIASETTLADQTSYDRINVGPATDSSFGTPFHAIRLASVDGDVEIETGDGTNQVIPQAHLSAGQIIPLTVQQVVSGGTTQTVSDIMLLGN